MISKPGSHRRFVPMVLVPAIVAALVAGCVAGASPPAATPAGSAGEPSPSPTPALSPTTSPSPTPAPSPTSTAIDAELVLRADMVDDIAGSRIPRLSVYRDGTVLRWSWDEDGTRAPTAALLTPDGLATLLDAVLSDPLVTGDDIGPMPDWAAGFTTYFITVRGPGGLVERSVTNAAPADRQGEVAAFVAFVERLVALDVGLPATAWAVPPDEAAPWVPATWLLKVTDWGYPSGAPLAVDVVDIDWPLTEGPLRFGEPFDTGSSADDAGAPRAVRCGVVTLEEALAIQEALRDVLGGSEVMLPGPERLSADLAWAEGDSHIAISLAAQLPDDPPDCSLDRSWP